LPTVIGRLGNEIPGLLLNPIQLPRFAATLADPRKLVEALAAAREEANNIFESMPADLYSPRYTVVEKKDGYEIRKYDGYAVATTPMA
ncbi:unnamed protein product, partial [Phaeothamnion confervicola]